MYRHLFFEVGYSDFSEEATDIEWFANNGEYYGDFVSGSAEVIKNSGSSITIMFSQYKFEVRRKGVSHEFILNGTLDFKCYLYD